MCMQGPKLAVCCSACSCREFGIEYCLLLFCHCQGTCFPLRPLLYPPILHSTATPPAPSSSCALTEGTGNTTQLTLSWTEPPSDDSIDQYCINSSPECPSDSSLCVGSNVSTHEYQVQEELQYNFTLFAVNCDDQNGTETAPVTVFPQGKFLFQDCLRLQY